MFEQCEEERYIEYFTAVFCPEIENQPHSIFSKSDAGQVILERLVNKLNITRCFFQDEQVLVYSTFDELLKNQREKQTLLAPGSPDRPKRPCPGQTVVFKLQVPKDDIDKVFSPDSGLYLKKGFTFEFKHILMVCAIDAKDMPDWEETQLKPVIWPFEWVLIIRNGQQFSWVSKEDWIIGKWSKEESTKEESTKDENPLLCRTQEEQIKDKTPSPCMNEQEDKLPSSPCNYGIWLNILNVVLGVSGIGLGVVALAVLNMPVVGIVLFASGITFFLPHCCSKEQSPRSGVKTRLSFS